MLLDTNPFFSYLPSGGRRASAGAVVVKAAFRRVFTLLFAGEVAEEVTATVAGRPDLVARIAPEDVDRLIRHVENVAEIVPRLPAPPPEVGRDRNADDLIAHAVVVGADHLIRRDKDLLDLVQVGGVRAVDPPAFLAVLRASGRLSP